MFFRFVFWVVFKEVRKFLDEFGFLRGEIVRDFFFGRI